MKGCDNTGAAGEQESTEQATIAALARPLFAVEHQLGEAIREKTAVVAAANANEERMLAGIEMLEADNKKLEAEKKTLTEVVKEKNEEIVQHEINNDELWTKLAQAGHAHLCTEMDLQQEKSMTDELHATVTRHKDSVARLTATVHRLTDRAVSAPF